MKKAVSILAAVLFFAGCVRGAGTAFTPLRAFTTPFTLRRGEYEITGEARCLADNEIRFSFTHPEALTFLTLTATGTGFAADVAGVPDGIAAADLPEDAPISVFAAVLRQAVFLPQTFEKEETGYRTRIETACGSAVCRFGEDGMPKQIVCGDVTVLFPAQGKEE